MSNIQNDVKYPWIEHFYDQVTFWFKLTPNHASMLTPNDQKKVRVTHKHNRYERQQEATAFFQISKATGAKFETRRQQVFGVNGYVPEVYAAMEKVAAKLQVAMPQMIVDLMKKDEEEFGKRLNGLICE